MAIDRPIGSDVIGMLRITKLAAARKRKAKGDGKTQGWCTVRPKASLQGADSRRGNEERIDRKVEPTRRRRAQERWWGCPQLCGIAPKIEFERKVDGLPVRFTVLRLKAHLVALRQVCGIAPKKW